ncbi:Protein of unknown function [Gryllus bimaculatus]|nr:Protein of unknown function [Gryllus bimaculatus]
MKNQAEEITDLELVPSTRLVGGAAPPREPGAAPGLAVHGAEQAALHGLHAGPELVAQARHLDAQRPGALPPVDHHLDGPVHGPLEAPVAHVEVLVAVVRPADHHVVLLPVGVDADLLAVVEEREDENAVALVEVRLERAGVDVLERRVAEAVAHAHEGAAAQQREHHAFVGVARGVVQRRALVGVCGVHVHQRRAAPAAAAAVAVDAAAPVAAVGVAPGRRPLLRARLPQQHQHAGARALQAVLAPRHHRVVQGGGVQGRQRGGSGGPVAHGGVGVGAGRPQQRLQEGREARRGAGGVDALPRTGRRAAPPPPRAVTGRWRGRRAARSPARRPLASPPARPPPGRWRPPPAPPAPAAATALPGWGPPRGSSWRRGGGERSREGPVARESHQ